MGAQTERASSADIDREIDKIKSEMIKVRRYIHMNPQLPGRESETAKLLSGRLQSLGLDVRTGVARTGVVGFLRGSRPGPVVALRADMDAEAVHEATDLPFSSLNPGVMHAAGHDMHVAVALGTASVLSALRDRLPGGVKFLFQPGSPVGAPAEESGAAGMIEEGVLENPPVVAVFGFHVWPETLGLAGSAPGVFLAAADTFRITIRRKSAAADNGPDAVAMAAHVITGLQSLLGRSLGPGETAQLSIGRIAGGSSADRIAEGVTLEGVLRTLTESARGRLSKAMEDAAGDIVESYGGDSVFAFERETPAVYNHPELFALLRPSFDSAFGVKRFRDIKPQMMADDFGRFSQKVPSFFFFLGVRNPKLPAMPLLHSPAFDPDERAIELGMKIMAHLVMDCLERQTALPVDGR